MQLHKDIEAHWWRAVMENTILQNCGNFSTTWFDFLFWFQVWKQIILGMKKTAKACEMSEVGWPNQDDKDRRQNEHEGNPNFGWAYRESLQLYKSFEDTTVNAHGRV